MKNIGKQSLKTWGDSLSDSNKEFDGDNTSMFMIEDESIKFDSLLVFLAKIDDKVDDEV